MHLRDDVTGLKPQKRVRSLKCTGFHNQSPSTNYGANKDNLCNYFACSIWAGGFLIGRSNKARPHAPSGLSGEERGLIPEQRLDTEPCDFTVAMNTHPSLESIFLFGPALSMTCLHSNQHKLSCNYTLTSYRPGLTSRIFWAVFAQVWNYPILHNSCH